MFFDFMTMVFNDGFPVNWEADRLLTSSLYNFHNLQLVPFLLSKGAIVRRKHIPSASSRIVANGDARLLQLLLANVPDPANIPV
jgi:hypothetical protein